MRKVLVGSCIGPLGPVRATLWEGYRAWKLPRFPGSTSLEVDFERL